MIQHAPIKGILLAGGKSSRMGQDKSMLTWRGKSFLQNMIDLFHAQGIEDITVLGRSDHPCGVEDSFPGAGPGFALCDFINQTRDHDTRYLITPVDMPLLSADLLKILINHDTSSFFQDFYLPCCLHAKAHDFLPMERKVQNILPHFNAQALSVPAIEKTSFTNCNNPSDYLRVQIMEKSLQKKVTTSENSIH